MARKISGGKSGKPAPGASSPQAHRPSREAVIGYIADNPEHSGKREIAKAFGLRGPDKSWLKDLLRELMDEGLVERRRKRLTPRGALPHVVVLDIFSRDSDGTLIARASEREEDDEHNPLVRITSANRMPGRPPPGVGDRVLARVTPSTDPDGPAYGGRVMKVLDKKSDRVLGVLRATHEGTLRIEPVVRGLPQLLIDAQAANGAAPGDLVEAEPLRAGRYGLPRGRIVNVVGSMASEKAVSMIALHAHEIPHVFPAAVLAEADRVVPAGPQGREDWRDLPLITIDPADARDHDDAVHALADSDTGNPGGVIITVAIADVAHYVTAGSALDAEALRRGNSVYFPDRVVPMLPERISNDLCSLRLGQDRPALAVRMTFSAQGRKIRHSFHRVMMRSAARLSYPQAQSAMDGAADADSAAVLESVLEPLWQAYRVLQRGRAHRQPLELDLPERKIVLNEDGSVDRVLPVERLEAHRLIEEFMIQANVAAAETLEARRQALIYRIHDAPSLAKQESLRTFLQSIGLSLAHGPQLRPAQFNGILSHVAGQDHEELVNQVVLRSQSQAEYATDNIGHFGLNLPRYAHFTSPIRRYADLVVHRALIRALELGADGLTIQEEERLDEIAALVSTAERRAMAAERETVDRLVAGHLARRLNDQFDARISGVVKAGLFVQLSQYGADGFVPISSLGQDYYHYDEAAHALTGERTGKGFRLGDTVEVRLIEIAPLAGAMRFEMISQPRPMPVATRSFHKAGRKGSKTRQRARATGRGRRS